MNYPWRHRSGYVRSNTVAKAFLISGGDKLKNAIDPH